MRREGVEHLVGQDETVDRRIGFAPVESRGEPGRLESRRERVEASGFDLDRLVPDPGGEIRALGAEPLEYRHPERTRARPEFAENEGRTATESVPGIGDGASDRGSEDRVGFGCREE